MHARCAYVLALVVGTLVGCGADLEPDMGSVEAWADADASDPDGMSQPSEDAMLAWVDADHAARRLGRQRCRFFVEG